MTAKLQVYITIIKERYNYLLKSYLNNHFTENSSKIHYNDRILLCSYFYKKTHKVKFTDSERELLRQLQNDLSVQYNMKYNN